MTMNPTLEHIAVCQIAPAPVNPNTWDDDKYEVLRRSIREEGFNGAIVVRALSSPMDTPHTVYQIIDGEHRWRAAQDEGVETIPAFVYAEGACSDAKAQALQVGFNKLRGKMDITAVAQALSRVDLAGVEHLTGFDSAELQDFTAMLEPPSAEDLLSGSMAAPESMEEPEDPDSAPRVYELTVVLPSAADLRNVRKALKKAGGRSKDPGRGLLKVLGMV